MMLQGNTLQSFDLILEDVSAEINLSINSLDQYTKSGQQTKFLKKSVAHLQKLKGVFTLLQMPGAQRLVVDAISLIKSLPKRPEAGRQRLLEVVTTSLARLMRYSEHVSSKSFDLPQLLLPTINELRASANVPTLSESIFFVPDGSKSRSNQSLVLLTSEESAAKSRHFRQMYQIGLIEVIRQTNLTGGLKMMLKATNKLEQECPRPHSPNLWWIANGLIQAYIDDTLALTKPRLKLFSRLDRQIRKVENKAENLLEDNKLELRLLTKEMLYLVSISGSSHPLISEITTHFGVQDYPVTDKILRDEYEELRGPSDQDFKSIAEALMAEIDTIEGILRNSQDHGPGKDDLTLAQKQMINLNNLLKILQVDEQSLRLTVAIDLVEKAMDKAEGLTAKDFNILIIVLDTIRKAVDQSELARHSGKASNRREAMSKAQKQFWDATMSQLKILMKKFSEFAKERDVKSLKEIPVILNEIKHGFGKLKVQPALPILDACQQFVQGLYHSPRSTSENAINLFADIISSLEFYLDTMAFTAQPSPRILQFAEMSAMHLTRND